MGTLIHCCTCWRCMHDGEADTLLYMLKMHAWLGRWYIAVHVEDACMLGTLIHCCTCWGYMHDGDADTLLYMLKMHAWWGRWYIAVHVEDACMLGKLIHCCTCWGYMHDGDADTLLYILRMHACMMGTHVWHNVGAEISRGCGSPYLQVQVPAAGDAGDCHVSIGLHIKIGYLQECDHTFRHTRIHSRACYTYRHSAPLWSALSDSSCTSGIKWAPLQYYRAKPSCHYYHGPYSTMYCM